MKLTKKMLPILLPSIIAIVLAGALADVLFTLTIPSSWHVNVATSLELHRLSDGAKLTSLSFTVDQGGSQMQELVLENHGNHAVNVQIITPDNTSEYQFTTNFVNGTDASPHMIDPGAGNGFWLTLTDIGMNSDTTYSGDFAFLAVG
jgi:hypothetical protein